MTDTEICPGCAGTGERWEGVECRDCGGSGEVAGVVEGWDEDEDFDELMGDDHD